MGTSGTVWGRAPLLHTALRASLTAALEVRSFHLLQKSTAISETFMENTHHTKSHYKPTEPHANSLAG